MTNWKTTVLGILAAATQVIGSGSHSWQQYAGAGLIAALGIFAHDAQPSVQ